MSERPRKAGPWPLVAISVLVVLLSAFLVVRLKKADEVAPVVKAPPAPPPAPVEPAPPPPPPPPATPDRRELDALLEAAAKAVEGKRWKEAEDLLVKAAALAAEEVKPHREKLDSARKAEEARQAAEALRKRDEAWAAARGEVEKLAGENKWDAATALLEKLVNDHPGISQDADFAAEVKRIARFREECDGVYVRAMSQAEKLFLDGKLSAASSSAEKSLLTYPERRPKVDEFQKKIRLARLDLEMVRIPSALCWIGSELNADERPRRQVKLPTFYIDRSEVTCEDYQAFVLATKRTPPPLWTGTAPPKGRERHPVSLVTWEDAKAYAEWSGKRLPTAEEWEVAARGPDEREYPWGGAFAEKENVFHANSVEYWQYQRALGATTPVDQPLGANGESAFRVQGMGGNVWEWTATGVKKGEGAPEFRILKGGSFMTSAKALRCANVLLEDPRLAHPDVGFRCARDAR